MFKINNQLVCKVRIHRFKGLKAIYKKRHAKILILNIIANNFWKN